MTDLSTLHPLVLLAIRIGLAALAYPLAFACAKLVLGTNRLSALRLERPFAEALLFAVGTAVVGALLGFDALDPRLLGTSLAHSTAARSGAALLFAAVAASPLVASLRAHRRDWPSTLEGRLPLVALFATSMVPAAALVAVRVATTATTMPFDPASLARAPLRAALVPSDANARLSLGFRFAAADDYDRARAELAFARELGADVARGYELESELAARMGDCIAAERSFRRALESSLQAGGRDIAHAELRLGGYFLPPSLITRCRFGARGARSY